VTRRKRSEPAPPPSAFYKKARLYADADIEEDIVQLLRSRGVNIVSARDLGHHTKDDSFQMAEATRQKRFLLTKNAKHFLSDRLVPFSQLKYGVIALEGTLADEDEYLAAIAHVFAGLIPFGDSFYGTKILVSGTRLVIRGRGSDGRVVRQRFELRGGDFVEVGSTNDPS
jgi:hypothetical protein